MAKQEDIRPIYHELQGYVSKAPSSDTISFLKDHELWESANQAIEELNKITGEDYNRFKMVPKKRGQGIGYLLEMNTYRGKLAGLIARLHGEYFASEAAPFKDMSSTVISQTQVQSQSQTQMVLELQSKIDEQLRDLEPGDKKHTFLGKVKGALASVKDYAGLLALYITTAQEVGLNLKELSELFK